MMAWALAISLTAYGVVQLSSDGETVEGLRDHTESSGAVTYYDYTACYYPEGIDPTSIFFFNRDAIETVYYRGYEDTDEPDLPFDSVGGSFRRVLCQEFQRENDFVQGCIAAGKRRSP